MKWGMRLTFLTPPFSLQCTTCISLTQSLVPVHPRAVHAVELCVIPATNTQPCAPHGRLWAQHLGTSHTQHLTWTFLHLLYSFSALPASCYPLALHPQKAFLLGWEISSSWFMQHLFLRHLQALSPDSTWWRSNIAPGLHDPVLLISALHGPSSSLKANALHGAEKKICSVLNLSVIFTHNSKDFTWAALTLASHSTPRFPRMVEWDFAHQNSLIVTNTPQISTGRDKLSYQHFSRVTFQAHLPPSSPCSAQTRSVWVARGGTAVGSKHPLGTARHSPFPACTHPRRQHSQPDHRPLPVLLRKAEKIRRDGPFFPCDHCRSFLLRIF